MIPIVFCDTCQENMPVVVVDYQEPNKNLIIPVIFCPQCEEILNAVEDLKLTWISEAEVSNYTNWKVTDELSK